MKIYAIKNGLLLSIILVLVYSSGCANNETTVVGENRGDSLPRLKGQAQQRL
jgi:hypothetical protein